MPSVRMVLWENERGDRGVSRYHVMHLALRLHTHRVVCRGAQFTLNGIEEPMGLSETGLD